MLTYKFMTGSVVSAVAAAVLISFPVLADREPDVRGQPDRAARRHVERPQQSNDAALAERMRRMRMEYNRRVMRLEQMQALTRADEDRWLYEKAVALKEEAHQQYERAMVQLREQHGQAEFEQALSKRDRIGPANSAEKKLADELAHWRVQRAKGQQMTEDQRRRLFNAWLEHQRELREARAEKRRNRMPLRRDIPENRRDRNRKVRDDDRRRQAHQHRERSAQRDREREKRDRRNSNNKRERQQRKERDPKRDRDRGG
jgi:hypothetical protein